MIEPIPLADLDARLRAGVAQYPGGRVEHEDEISLLCPKCRGHRVLIYRATNSDLRALSIVPHRASVLLREARCGVVHFFIIDGRVHPAGSCGGWDD